MNNVPRKVESILTVTNGGPYGDWHDPHFCAEGTYAVGYNMRVRLAISRVNEAKG